MGTLLTAAAFGLICLVLSLPALRRPHTRRYAIAAALFTTALIFSTDVRHVFPSIPRLPGSYNWTGKLFELCCSLIAIGLLTRWADFSPKELGLTLHFNPGTARDVLRLVVPILLLEAVLLWFLVPPEMPGFEDHLFQLTAPGITEELAFRGVLLALLDRAFLGRVRILGADLGWSAVITSLLFGLWHGFELDAHLKPSLDLAPMAIPMVGGFVLAWCRARSGTLLLPIAIHAGMNEAANLIAVAKVRKTK